MRGAQVARLIHQVPPRNLPELRLLVPNDRMREARKGELGIGRLGSAEKENQSDCAEGR